MKMDWKSLARAACLLIVSIALVLGPATARDSRGLDGPEYDVVRQEGKIEIRDYQGYILASVNVSSDYDGALSSGFMKLFNYISGRNTNGAGIKMTAPVTSEKVNKDEYMISFVMPGRYTLDTLPVPDDKDIRFKKIDPHRAAVIGFSGRMNEKLADKKTGELQEWLVKNDLKPKSGFILAQYDAPWIPGFMRRNEIIVEV